MIASVRRQLSNPRIDPRIASLMATMTGSGRRDRGASTVEEQMRIHPERFIECGTDMRS